MKRLFLVSAWIAAVVSLAAGCSLGVHDAGSASSTTAVNVRPPASCLPRLPSSIDNSGLAGLPAQLVPITATSARVCRYAPLDSKRANALVGSGVVTDGAAVRKLESETNALHHISNAEQIPCPLNPTAPGWSIVFADGESSVVVIVAASDCGFATNGVVSAGPTTSWLAALALVAKSG